MGRAANRNKYRPNGPHTEMTARVAPELHETVRAAAKERGVSVSRLVGEVLEERFGNGRRRLADPTQLTAVDILAGRTRPRSPRQEERMTRPYRRHPGAPALLELLAEFADADDALSATEVAKRLGTSRGFVYAALRYGELQGFKSIVSGQFRVRIPVAELERYLAQHHSQQAAS